MLSFHHLSLTEEHKYTKHVNVAYRVSSILKFGLGGLGKFTGIRILVANRFQRGQAEVTGTVKDHKGVRFIHYLVPEI